MNWINQISSVITAIACAAAIYYAHKIAKKSTYGEKGELILEIEIMKFIFYPYAIFRGSSFL